MFTSLLALLAFRQNPAAKPATPIVFAGVVGPGRCRIPIQFAKTNYLFLVDTGIETSYIRSDIKAQILKADPKAQLSLGDASVSLRSISTQDSTVYREFPPIAGIIGMDILSKVAFSVDYNTQQVTVWPDKADIGDMEKSVFGPHDKAGIISLISEQGYRSMFLQTSLGESELDTGAPVSMLAKTATESPEVFSTGISAPLELFDGTAGKATQVIVRNMQLGDQQIVCQPFLLSDTADVGVISPNLLGRKILFDFPHKEVEFVPPTGTDRACTAIASMLRGEVQVRKGDLFLKTQKARNLGVTEEQWTRVISIAGRKGSDWLKLFASNDPSTANDLQEAYEAVSRGGEVLVEENGKPTRLLVAPFIH